MAKAKKVRKKPAPKPEKVRIDPENARTHPMRNKDAIRKSLRRFGPGRSIVVDKNNVVLAGNGTVAEAEAMGLSIKVVDGHPDELIAIRRKDWTAEEARAYAIADNRSAEFAEWDEPVLYEQLGQLAEFDPTMLEDLDFDPGEVQSFLNDDEVVEDEAPDPTDELLAKWKVERGQVWEIGRHRLMCGDATDAEDVKKVMGGEKAGLCFTSPPYVNQRTYGGSDLNVDTLCGFLDHVQSSMVCVNLGIVRQNKQIVRYWDSYISRAGERGFILLSWNIWDRGHAHSIGQQIATFPIEHEFIFVFSCPNPSRLVPTVPNKCAGETVRARIRKQDGTQGPNNEHTKRDKREIGTVYRGTVSASHSEHPATFPVDFPATYIKAVSDDVYDPFLGSGTTMVAAEQLNRTCYGIEIEPRYCSVVLERMTKLGLDCKLQTSNGRKKS